MTTPQQRGYEFEEKFKESFKQSFPNGFIYKLIDTHSLEGAKRAASNTTRGAWNKIIIPKVPSDYICINNGETIWVECKSTMNKTSLPLTNIKIHQLEFAAKIEEAGGRYYFAIRHQVPRNSECFLITLNDIIRLKTANGGHKSIRWEQLREDPFVKRPPLLKGSKFGIGCLFND